MKVDKHGCALCQSTWGNTWDVIEGERLFFCCPVCASQYRNLVAKIKSWTRWEQIDSLEIRGDRTGREGTAGRAEERFRFRVAFNPQGEIRHFEEVAVPSK